VPTGSAPGSPAPASPSAGSPSAESPAAGTPTSSSPSAKKSASSKPTKAAKPPKGPSVAISKVPVGGGVIMDDPDQYVVTQPTRGDFKAFSKICTHQSRAVSKTTTSGGKVYVQA